MTKTHRNSKSPKNKVERNIKVRNNRIHNDDVDELVKEIHTKYYFNIERQSKN